MMDRLKSEIRTGLMVHTRDNQMLGTVERVHGNGFDVKGEHVAFTDVDRVEGKTVFLKEAGSRWSKLLGGERTGSTEARGVSARDTEGTIRVPVTEERLNVEKRAGEVGQVEIRKTVREERVEVPVSLTREEVRVERVDVADRPMRAGELDQAFQEGAIRVPVRGEEAIVTKEAVVTGEVVVNKERKTERQTVTDTVRKEEVNVDDTYNKLRDNFKQDFEGRRTRQVGGRPQEFTEVEPRYRYGVEAAHDTRFRGRKWNEVEPEVRREYETRTKTVSTQGNDAWAQLREEIREGFERVR